MMAAIKIFGVIAGTTIGCKTYGTVQFMQKPIGVRQSNFFEYWRESTRAGKGFTGEYSMKIMIPSDNHYSLVPFLDVRSLKLLCRCVLTIIFKKELICFSLTKNFTEQKVKSRHHVLQTVSCYSCHRVFFMQVCLST